MALAHPTLQQEAREAIATDYFVDAMDDADFALKVRERAPATLDEALRVALQLGAWMNDASKSRSNDAYSHKMKTKVRGATNANSNLESKAKANDHLAGRMMGRIEADFSKRLDEIVKLQRQSLALLAPRTRRQLSQNGSPAMCWKCGQPGHIKRNCQSPVSRPVTELRGAVSRGSRVLDRANVYLRMTLAGKVLPVFVDSGCEVTLMPKADVDAAGYLEVFVRM